MSSVLLKTKRLTPNVYLSTVDVVAEVELLTFKFEIFWSTVTRAVSRRTRHRFRDTHIKAVSRGIPLATALQTARRSLALQHMSNKRDPSVWSETVASRAGCQSWIFIRVVRGIRC